MFRTQFYFVLLALVFITPLQGQTSEVYRLPKFQKLGIEEGLANLNISSILEDKLGYMWIGTNRGLNRYDGKSFTHYMYGNEENSLFHNWVTGLHMDEKGNIFVSTRYGLNLLHPRTEKLLRISSGKEFFMDFVEYSNSTYGISDLRGLCVYNEKSQLFERIQAAENDKTLSFLISDEKTGIWARTVENLPSSVAPLSVSSKNSIDDADAHFPNLINYNPRLRKFTNYPFPDSIKGNYYGPVVKLDSVLLILTNQILFDLTSLEFKEIPDEWSKLPDFRDHDINSIQLIEKDKLLIATRNRGFYIYDFTLNSFANYNKSNSNLTSNWINCSYRDSDKNLWIGTFDQGVNIAFHGKGMINTNNALNKITANKFINSITSDRKGNYFIGSRYEGFFVFDKLTSEVKHFHVANSFLESDHIRTIYIDSEEKIWIATVGKCYVVDSDFNLLNTFEIQGTHQGFSSLVEMEEIVIGGSDFQGFFIFDRRGDLLKQELSLGSNITEIIATSNDEILVSSYDHGIYTYNINTEKFQNLYRSGLPGASNLNQPITMHLDADSILWIGNYVAGLHKLDLKSGESEIYTSQDGLPDNDIVGIVEDDNGRLWLSTSYGLACFDKEKEFISYSYNEGLENLQFHAKAAHKDAQGTILFGGNNGLTYFNPDALSELENTNPPRLILTSLIVQNKRISVNDETGILSEIPAYTDEISLNHKQNNISLEYHAFDYLASNEIRYSYILEGLNSEWNKVGNRNYANFSNLDPGLYTFKVKAQNNKGLWTEVSSLDIHIQPSPFLTAWAFLIYALLISVIVFISFRLVLRAKIYKNQLELEHNERVRENEIAQMKMRFFTNISHEIRTPLTLIKGNVDLLAKKSAFNKEQEGAVKGIQYSTNRLLALVNQLLSFRKLEKDALELYITRKDIIKLTQNLLQPHYYIASHKNISINIETDFESLTIPIDEDKYEKILSNLLSNSLKHSKNKGLIRVKVSYAETNDVRTVFPKAVTPSEKAYIKVSVIDNGTGIAEDDLPYIFERYRQTGSNNRGPDYSGTGIGLNFTRRLVELHKGSITVSSVEDGETCFSVYLPVTEKAYSKEDWLRAEYGALKKKNPVDPVGPEPGNSEKDSVHILIVEDDPELNRFLCTSLGASYKVLSTYNGRQGLLLVKNHMPRIVISDIMMPEMDGFELCKRIRDDEMIAHIPVILLTAKSDADSRIEGYKYGADEYISKPFDIEVLLARINNLIEQRKNLQKSFKMGLIEENTSLIQNPFELKFIKQLESVVASEYHSPDLNVNELASKMNMPRASFYRKFMSIMDVSPKDFIAKYRINKAVEMIKEGEKSFGEISYLCGFSSQNIFTTTFKKEKGVTPSRFKDSM